MPKITLPDNSVRKFDKPISVNELAEAFNKNFDQFAEYANDEIMAAAPKASINV